MLPVESNEASSHRLEGAASAIPPTPSFIVHFDFFSSMRARSHRNASTRSRVWIVFIMPAWRPVARCIKDTPGK